MTVEMTSGSNSSTRLGDKVWGALRHIGPWQARKRESVLAATIEARLLGLLVEQNLASFYATLSVIIISALVAPLLPHTILLLCILFARTAALGAFQISGRLLGVELRKGNPCRQSVRKVVLANGLCAFLWGAITWPLVINQNLDFMSFLIVVISLFSVCLSIVSAGLHRDTLIATAVGGGLGLAPKIALLTVTIGPLLPVGFAVYIITIIAYALVIGRQARGGVMLHLRTQRYSGRLDQANRALQAALERANWLADRDALTELRNRRAFESDLNTTADRFAHRSLCLMLLDIDHFKHINDRFGHDTGDGVLVAVGTALRQWERGGTGRLTGRWGGEEFIVLVALHPGEKPAAIAEDLRLRIEVLSEQLHWPDSVKLTTSIGCADLQNAGHFDEALILADEALYAAKNSGRNCWRIAA